MALKMKEKVVHSSLKEVLRLGTDSELPSPGPRIGILIRSKQFGGYELLTHSPKIDSIIEGEIFECEVDELDTELRSNLLLLAEYCSSLSNHLSEQAKRLREKAKEEILIFESKDESNQEIQEIKKIESTSKDRAKSSQSEPLESSLIDIDLFS